MSELQTRPERRRAARASTEAALRDLIHALAGTVEVEELAQRAAQACATATGALGAYIERVDVSAAEVEIIAAVGEQTPPIGTRVPYPGSLTDELIKRGTPEVLADVTDVGERMAPYLAESCNHCIGLVAPLNGDSGVVGSLVLLQAADQAPLREDEIDRVITIGEVASIALRRVHILSRERQAREHLTILAETGSLLDAGLDFQTLLDRFAHLLVERLCDWCVIYVPTSRGARRAALAGRDPETELAVRESLGEVLTEPSDAPAMQVLRTGKSMLLSDVSESALEAAAAQSPIYARILREHRPRSAIAVPLIARGRLVGVLAVESRDPLAFLPREDTILVIVGGHLASAIEQLTRDTDEAVTPPPPTHTATPALRSARTRRFNYFQKDDCIFVDGEYLIRNVPAKIFWRVLKQHKDAGRTEFTNRELRMDAWLGLPEVKDNLETRLILLRRRLEQKCPDVRLTPRGRGRFALETDAAIDLSESPA